MKKPNENTYEITYFLKQSYPWTVAWWKWCERIEGKEYIVWDYQLCSIKKWIEILKDLWWDGDKTKLDTDFNDLID